MKRFLRSPFFFLAPAGLLLTTALLHGLKATPDGVIAIAFVAVWYGQMALLATKDRKALVPFMGFSMLVFGVMAWVGEYLNPMQFSDRQAMLSIHTGIFVTIVGGVAMLSQVVKNIKPGTYYASFKAWQQQTTYAA